MFDIIGKRRRFYIFSLLITIPGIDKVTAWSWMAELGPDMSVFPMPNIARVAVRTVV